MPASPIGHLIFGTRTCPVPSHIFPACSASSVVILQAVWLRVLLYTVCATMPQVSEYLEFIVINIFIIYIPLLDVFLISYLCTLINYTLSGVRVLQKSYALVIASLFLYTYIRVQVKY